MIFFLNSEARYREVHVIGGELIHRIVIAALLPRGAYTECLAETRYLLRRGDSADLRDTAADEIDEVFGNQWRVFAGAGEQLAHRHRRGGDLANPAEPIDLLRRQDVLHEKQVVWLEAFG